MAEHKALTKQEDPIYKMLAQYKGAIASVLPKHLTPEKMLRLAYTAIHRTPKLKQCTPVSLINGIIEISSLGLELGRTAHLIPFGREAQVIVDYKGMIDLAHRSDKVATIVLKPVYEKEVFEVVEGTERYIKHIPVLKDRGELVAAYAIITFKDGSFDFEVVGPDDIEIIKKRSPGAKKADSPWNTEDEPTMWCKSAMRKVAKRTPQSPEFQKAAYLEELLEAGIKQNLSHVTNDIGIEDFKNVTPVKEVIEDELKEKVKGKIKRLQEKGQVEPGEKEKPKMTQKNNLDFVKVVQDLKKQLSDDEVYYKLIGLHGYEHCNEIIDKKAQKAFYQDLKLEVERVKKQ